MTVSYPRWIALKRIGSVDVVNELHGDSGTVAPVARNVLPRVEVTVDVEEVRNLGQLMLRQLTEIRNVLVCRITVWHADQLGFATMPGHDPEDPYHPRPDPYAGIGRFRHQHERIQRFTIGSARTEDVTVVSWIGERSRQST